MRQKNYMHLTDVARMMKPAAFTTLVKPVGSLCNFDCAYCYYTDKAALYGGQQPVMSDQLLELYISQYIAAVGVPAVSFCWHGGEPLLAGLPFYRRAVELQQKYRGEKSIENSLQTNGSLITQEWCDFFRENHFLIGLSLDGPAEVHDAFRRDKGGRPTHQRVMQAIELMRRNGVEYNILCTVNRHSEGRGREIYRFLRPLGRFMQFLPVTEHLKKEEQGPTRVVPPGTPGSQPAPWSVSPQGFGRFMCDIFDDWVVRDVGEYYVQLFDITLGQWCGVPPTLCAFGETCGNGLAVEHNGDVYVCDHFVYPQYRLGNLRERSIGEMQQSEALFDFGNDKRDSLPIECRRCPYHFACHGGCPKHRFATTQSGHTGLNSLCAGYKQFFIHTDPYMRAMRTLLAKGQAPAGIMPWAQKKLDEQNKRI